MELHEYSNELGRLVANLQSLEFILRAFLQKLSTAKPMGIPKGMDIYSYPVGTELPENEFTSYDSLGQLIDKYNAEMKVCGLSAIDRTLVEIRDALAHGRISSASLSENTRLIKYSNPVNGKVRVVFNDELNHRWFRTQTKRVADAILIVAKRLES